jgi:uncharacterized protein
MKLRTFAGALAVALTLAGQALAQSAAPSAKQLELSRRFLAAIEFKKTMSVALDSLSPLILAEFARRQPSMTGAQRTFILEAVKDSFATLSPTIIDKVAPAYAATFSEEELAGIVAFYESPAGRAMTVKTADLNSKVNVAMQQLGPQIQAEVAQRVCTDLSCTALKPGR